MNDSMEPPELWKVYENWNEEDVAWIANQEKASNVLGVENLPNQRFSFQGEDNNDWNLREEDHKRSIASWDGEDSRRTSTTSSQQQVATETEGAVAAAKAGIVSQKFLQTGNWEKAAKVLGVVDILDPTFSKEKQCQKDIKPKEKRSLRGDRRRR